LVIGLKEDDVVLPCGRILFANGLQKSSKNLQKVQRANGTGTGTVKVSLGP
jgi:hypothetical protein